MRLREAANGDLVAGGFFRVAGSRIVNGLARWDGLEWQGFGDGLSRSGEAGSVQDFAFLPNGDIFAVGYFNSSSGVPLANAAIWDGANWSSPGTGLASFATDLTVLPNGVVAVIGDFDSAGGIANDGLAIWDGVSWSALPSTGLSRIRAVATANSGDLLVAGNAAPGDPDVLRWNGTSWSGLAGISTSSIIEVTKLLPFPNGDLLIAGTIFNAGTPFPLAIYDGTQLQTLTAPTTVAGQKPALAMDANGMVLLGNVNGSTNITLVQRYDGVQWTSFGTTARGGIASVLPLSNGSVAVGRRFPLASSTEASSVSISSGSAWQDVGDIPGFQVEVTRAMPGGDVIVGGSFTEIGGVAASNIARWDGLSWHPLAQGVDGRVTALDLAPDGSLLVGGNFTTAGGTPAMHLARWNGSTWSTIGSGLPATRALSIAQNDAGELVAVTEDGARLFYFDGQSWSTPQAPGGSANEVLAMPSGEFLLLGSFVDFSQASPVLGGGLRLVGGTVTMDSDLLGVHATTGKIDPNGDLLIGTRVNTLNGIARVVAGVPQFLPIGPINGPVHAFDFLPNGDLLVVGDFDEVAQQPVGGMLRWDGSSIDALGGGVQFGQVDSLAIGARGELFVSGPFQIAGGLVSNSLAMARTSCPAEVATFGAGCTGSAGVVALASDDLPWLGATWNAVATGMTVQSLAVHAVGETSSVVPLPLGAPGCGLFVGPVLVDLVVPQNGEVDVEFAIPNASVLIGNDLFSQVVGLELDQSLALLQTTSSNALQLTVGSF